MTAESFTLFEKLLGYKASDDGKHGLFKVKTGSEEFAFALPATELLSLVEAALNNAGACRKIAGADPKVKQVVHPEWWEFGLTPDGDGLVLSFRLPGGAEMSFQVHKGRLSQMRETLQSMEGIAPMESQTAGKQ